MTSLLKLSILAFVASCVAQDVAEYGQCGGIGYTGSTTCTSPYTCQELNAYYYQCLPATSTTTTTTSSTSTTSTKTTTTTTATTSGSSSSTTTTSTTALPSSTGFVGVESSPSPHFTLDGQPFYFAGTNAYYVQQLDTDDDIISVFESMVELGLTVVRTNAYNEVTAPQDYGAYYQLWTDGVPAINTGANGFPRLDLTLEYAAQYDIKVILMLTNNWEDYGGMDVYVDQLNPGGYHDSFYTNETVIAAFKNYVEFVVNRYSNNTAVFAWELANEPCCSGSVANDASPGCNATAEIVPWATEISEYIHSLDPNHLVTLGDIGFFCWINDTSYEYIYQYACGAGPDASAVSQIPGIDFTTFHLYPEDVGENTTWGNTFITQHAYVQQASGKPTILEEFGISEGDSTKATVYAQWYNTVLEMKVAGAMYWELENTDAEVVDYTESDSNAVPCPAYTDTCPVIEAFAASMAALNT